MKNFSPYVKKYDSNGILMNPITKDNHYLFGKEKIKIGLRFWKIIQNKYFKGNTIVRQ